MTNTTIYKFNNSLYILYGLLTIVNLIFYISISIIYEDRNMLFVLLIFYILYNIEVFIIYYVNNTKNILLIISDIIILILSIIIYIGVDNDIKILNIVIIYNKVIVLILLIYKIYYRFYNIYCKNTNFSHDKHEQLINTFSQQVVENCPDNGDDSEISIDNDHQPEINNGDSSEISIDDDHQPEIGNGRQSHSLLKLF